MGAGEPLYKGLRVWGGVVLLCLAGVAAAEDDLTSLSLDELLNVEITSVSKKEESRSAAAAAVYVITSEDIRRSPARTIPDLLRTVPGLNVAQLDASKWSVTSRGFGGRYSNKLLVLIDGRSIYSPNFAGVEWEEHTVVLEDIDRIEIIRGPGSALWGANAVNGVINIVTKHAAETQGGLVVIGAGNEEDFFNTLRYGGALGEEAFYRVYAKYFTVDEREFDGGGKANDGWRMYQSGFRVDWNITLEDKLTVQGDIYDNRTDETLENAFLFFPHRRIVNGRADREGGNITARWSHTVSDDSDFELQFFMSHIQDEDEEVVSEWRRMYDLDYLQRLRINDRHELVWGGGIRVWDEDIDNTRFIAYFPEERTDYIYSAFVQDEISFLNDRLNVIVGAKFEVNSFTGFEFQPNVRAAWTPNEKHTLWGAISRAVRTPSRAEDDISLLNRVFPGRIALILEGNNEFESEDLLAYELGYRHEFNENLFLDLAFFYNDYTDLRTIEVTRPRIFFRPFPWHLGIPAEARNNLEANTYGVEAVMNWQPRPWWQIEASYSFLEIDLDFHTRTPDLITKDSEGDTPEQQWVLQNEFQLRKNLALDTTLRWVDRLPTLGVDDYFNLDVQLRWQARENLEFALVGQNLIDSGRVEFAPTFVNSVSTEVERSFYGKVTWRF